MDRLEISVCLRDTVCSWPDVLDPVLRQQDEPLRIPPRSKPHLKWLRVLPVVSAEQVALSVFLAQHLKRGYAVGMIQKNRPHRCMERGLTGTHGARLYHGHSQCGIQTDYQATVGLDFRPLTFGFGLSLI